MIRQLLIESLLLAPLGGAIRAVPDLSGASRVVGVRRA